MMASPSDETLQSKLNRKQEAKILKRQRIVDAGGTRPRKKRSDEEGAGKTTSGIKKSNKKKKKNNGGNQSREEEKSRFGKVMINTPCPNKPRTSTLSIAIPGSIVSNAQTTELRTYLIGQIARACTIYHVDEIIVFDDNLSQKLKVRTHYQNRNRGAGGDRNYYRRNNETKDGGSKEGEGTAAQEEKPPAKIQELAPSTDPHTFMANILQYCECPQYLRRHFFPMHPDLQFAGLLNPLDAPHHVRVLDKCLFRDGVVTEKRAKIENGEDGGSHVDCGIRGKLVE